MRMPNQAHPVKRSMSIGYLEGGVQPSDCPWYKAAACAVAVGLCADSCALGPEVCFPCFAGLGQTSCIDCLNSNA